MILIFMIGFLEFLKRSNICKMLLPDQIRMKLKVKISLGFFPVPNLW